MLSLRLQFITMRMIPILLRMRLQVITMRMILAMMQKMRMRPAMIPRMKMVVRPQTMKRGLEVTARTTKPQPTQMASTWLPSLAKLQTAQSICKHRSFLAYFLEYIFHLKKTIIFCMLIS
jgi:hypothetical protein